MNETMKDFFGEPIYSYTESEAVEDGVLATNFRKDVFKECSIITSNLYERIKEIAFERSVKNVFEVETNFLLGCLMMGAKNKYDKELFIDDEDKDFFVIPANDEGLVVWFVRNENGKLTAMLPRDY